MDLAEPRTGRPVTGPPAAATAERDDGRPVGKGTYMEDPDTEGRETPPGMTPAEEWSESDVHKHSTYKCGKCGESFDSPEEVYAHLDAQHKGGQS